MGSPPKTAPGGGGDPGKAALRGASLLITLQVLSRALTFLANQVLLRFLTAHLLGVSARLEAYYLSILFFARESLRVAIQRQPVVSSETENETQAVVNLGWLAVPLGTAVAAGLGKVLLRYGLEEEWVGVSVGIYALAAVVELVSEPAFVLMQLRLRFGVRAAAESVATFLRCFVTLGVAVWAARTERQLGVLPFALGQLAYGVALLCVYAWHAGVVSLVPRQVRKPGGGGDYFFGWFYRPTLGLAGSMMAQSVVKHFLTQGDTVLVSILSTTRDQGVYALANNYGGLVARLVFQPVEESSRSYFSRLLSTTTTKTSTDNNNNNNTENKKKQEEKEATTKASQDLHTLLKLYIILSTLILTIGPPLAPPLLTLVAGRRWARDEGAGAVLATYCYYVPLLALNGLAEAFVASVASGSEVHAQSVSMALFSLVFAAAGWVFLRVLGLGAEGLVWANMVNMGCRIVWCGVFVKRYFARREVGFSITSLVPGGLTVGVCVVGRWLVGWTGEKMGGESAIMEIIGLGAGALPVVMIFAFSERQFLTQCYRSLRGPEQQKLSSTSSSSSKTE